MPPTLKPSAPNSVPDSSALEMSSPSGGLSAGHKSLVELESIFASGVYDCRLLQDYYQRIVSLNLVDRGRRIFVEILRHQPNVYQVRSLLVALSLKQEDYAFAMCEIQHMLAMTTPDDGLIDAGLTVRARFTETGSKAAGHAETSIGLCMIVRNESAGLGACLHAVGDLVDDVVVVDTGSTDRSRDVARIFGARTYSYPWGDDFSAARNFGLDHAECEWVLVLDADETISAQDQSSLRRLLAAHREKPVAFSIETRNYTTLANTLGWQANAGTYPQQEAGLGWYPSRKVRIFPRSGSVRFCYPVHELVEPSLKAAGIPILHCPVPVHHYGHLNETRRHKKSHAYFSMGYAKLEQLGDNPVALRELAVQAGQLGFWPEAMQLWQRFLKHQPAHAEAFVNLSGACWQMERYADALDFGRRALALNPELKEAQFNIAVTLLLTGRAGQAADELQRLLVKHPDYLAAKFMLAASLACAGDAARSRNHLLRLAKTPAGEALVLSIKELSEKLCANHLGAYADAVVCAAECLKQ